MQLPLNCIARYEPAYLAKADADALFSLLLDDPSLSQRQTVQVADQTFELDFGKAIFLEPALFASGAFPDGEANSQSAWGPLLAKLAQRLAQDLGQNFAVCVAIYYPDGKVGMDYHRDYPAFGDTSHLASISLGAERIFSLRELVTQAVINTELAHGSLFYMGPGCQDNYEHALQPAPANTTPRINITFRLFGHAT